jgi:hypothetical protein
VKLELEMARSASAMQQLLDAWRDPDAEKREELELAAFTALAFSTLSHATRAFYLAQETASKQFPNNNTPLWLEMNKMQEWTVLAPSHSSFSTTMNTLDTLLEMLRGLMLRVLGESQADLDFTLLRRAEAASDTPSSDASAAAISSASSSESFLSKVEHHIKSEWTNEQLPATASQLPELNAVVLGLKTLHEEFKRKKILDQLKSSVAVMKALIDRQHMHADDPDQNDAEFRSAHLELQSAFSDKLKKVSLQPIVVCDTLVAAALSQVLDFQENDYVPVEEQEQDASRAEGAGAETLTTAAAPSNSPPASVASSSSSGDAEQSAEEKRQRYYAQLTKRFIIFGGVSGNGTTRRTRATRQLLSSARRTRCSSS